MTTRVINFNPGPAVLPLPVLEQAQRELLDYAGTGMSIVEHSHRAKPYEAIHARAKATLRELLAIPDDYDVLFMQGGASAQFALIPMNLLPKGGSADYVMTGVWAEKAFEEAKVIGSPRVAATTKEGEIYTRVPKQEELSLDPKAAYVHVTTNNTIFGTQFHTFPKTDAPLVADMSSDILWRPIDVSKFGLIYAGAQKNAGIAGITFLIVKKDLVARAQKEGVPKIFRYGYVAKEDSLQNTIPVFPMYMLALTLDWVKREGGLPAMEKRNRDKAQLVYDAIDARKDFYRAPVEEASRSVMNIVFRLPSEELDAKFIQEAAAKGLVGLKGHRISGGIRASLYNAMTIEGTKMLVDFMAEFARKNGSA